MKEHFLLTPGPTPIPPQVRKAGAKPIWHHRTPRFQSLVKECSEGLKYLFCTKEDVYTLTSSGTGAMEAAVANLVSPGDKVITLEAGKFGERWTKLCKAYGAVVDAIKVEWGKAVEPAQLEAALGKNPDAKAVFTQLCETSTGVVMNVEAFAGLTRKTLLVVDGISGIGADPCKMDEWGVDVLIAGSQKAMMLPPGLSFISVSPRAWRAVEDSRSPRFYFDLRAYKAGIDAGRQPYTPAISLVFQLKKSLEMIRKETIKKIWKRHEMLAQMMRKEIRSLGLDLFAERPSNALTAVRLPPGVDGGALIRIMRDELGVTIAGAQREDLKGKMIRIAHMGYVREKDLAAGLEALREGLGRLGWHRD